MQWEQICLHNEKVTLHNEVAQLLLSPHHGSVSSGRLTVKNSLLNHILPEAEDWATTRKKRFHHTHTLNTERKCLWPEPLPHFIMHLGAYSNQTNLITSKTLKKQKESTLSKQGERGSICFSTFTTLPAGGKLEPSKIKSAASSALMELSKTVTCEENGVSTQSLDPLNSTHGTHRHSSWQLCRGFTCRHNLSGRTLLKKALSNML